jgi:NADH-quinone oxidoreductase subunit A
MPSGCPVSRPQVSSASTVLLLAFDISGYLPILLLIGMAITFAVVNLVATHAIGPTRTGTIKESTYESGMNPFGSARKRFNIRFYILAMTFLVFDVEIVFLYPWAVTFTQLEPMSSEAGLFLARILFFLGTSVIAYIYAWRKGVFRWD